MGLLDNAKILEFFGSGECSEGKVACCGIERCMAVRVLAAMEKPIRGGDRILLIGSPRGEVTESTLSYDLDGFHPWYLRLPDRFQPSEKKECFHYSGSMAINAPCPECGENLVWNLDLSAKAHKEKPKEPEKCVYSPPFINRCDCADHKPADPVEENIKEKMHYGEHSIWSDVQLHELVALARREGGSNA